MVFSKTGRFLSKAEIFQWIAKGAGGKGPRQKTSKIVKKCQKVFRHFSTIFAQGKKRPKSSKSVKKFFDTFRQFSRGTIFPALVWGALNLGDGGLFPPFNKDWSLTSLLLARFLVARCIREWRSQAALHALSGPLNRLNAILSLLQPLDRYRTPSAIGSAIGRPLSRPISPPNKGRSPQPPRSKPLGGLNRAIVVL